MMKDRVFSRMTSIADKTIKHYKTDFTVYDTQAYGRMYEGTKFIWQVCEYGTYILGIPAYIKKQLGIKDFEKVDSRLLKPGYEMTLSEYLGQIRGFSESVINYYQADNSEYFLVTKNKEIKRITAEKALKIVRK